MKKLLVLILLMVSSAHGQTVYNLLGFSTSPTPQYPVVVQNWPTAIPTSTYTTTQTGTPTGSATPTNTNTPVYAVHVDNIPTAVPQNTQIFPYPTKQIVDIGAWPTQVPTQQVQDWVQNWPTAVPTADVNVKNWPTQCPWPTLPPTPQIPVSITNPTTSVSVSSLPNVAGSVSLLNGSAPVSVNDIPVSTLLYTLNTLTQAVTTLMNSLNGKVTREDTGSVTIIGPVPAHGVTVAQPVTVAQGTQYQMQGLRSIENYFNMSVSITTPLTFIVAGASAYNDIWPMTIQNQSATACTMTIKTSATVAYGPFIVAANTTYDVPSLCEKTANQPWSLTLTNAVTQIYVSGQYWANTQ
jgi:hypothetical protein